MCVYIYIYIYTPSGKFPYLWKINDHHHVQDCLRGKSSTEQKTVASSSRDFQLDRCIADGGGGNAQPTARKSLLEGARHSTSSGAKFWV